MTNIRYVTQVALLLLLALSGCGTNGFMRDGASYNDFYQELRQCEAENTPQFLICGNNCGQVEHEIRKRRNMCMFARGWKLSKEESAFRP